MRTADALVSAAICQNALATPSAAGVEATSFRSVLFADATAAESRDPPNCFRDLNLDQIVAGITAGYEAYDLAPLFHAPLRSSDAVVCRQEVTRELEHDAVMSAVKAFSDRMHQMRVRLDNSQKAYYPQERQRWFLDAAIVYGEAVERLYVDLNGLDLESRGLRGWRAFLAGYVRSPAFRRPIDEARRIRAELDGIRYAVLIDGDTVTVRHYDGEADYSAAVIETFEKFRRGAAKNYLAKIPERTGMNHIMAQIGEGVARLHPQTFDALKAFYSAHSDFVDKTVARFEREIQFYVAYLEFIEPLRRAGLGFCYPRVSASSKEVAAREAFDLALAAKRVPEGASVVGNDFALSGQERLLVVSGPNQGGKTTFARMFGQMHYLGSLGLPVPGAEARLFLPDRIYTHFEREEDIATLRGKLHDDLVRMRDIVERATPDSIVIINEIFASTTIKDAVLLGKRIMRKLSGLDTLGVCVTFLTELTAFDEKTVSMVGQVAPDDPAVRTFKVVREAANGLSYALAIARKHGVTYGQLRERIKP